MKHVFYEMSFYFVKDFFQAKFNGHVRSFWFTMGKAIKSFLNNNIIVNYFVRNL